MAGLTRRLDILIGKIDNLIPRIKAYVKEQHADAPGDWDLDFHIYGKDQSTPAGPGEMFIICEAMAESQSLANSLASKARVAMIVRISGHPLTGLIADTRSTAHTLA